MRRPNRQPLRRTAKHDRTRIAQPSVLSKYSIAACSGRPGHTVDRRPSAAIDAAMRARRPLWQRVALGFQHVVLCCKTATQALRRAEPRIARNKAQGLGLGPLYHRCPCRKTPRTTPACPAATASSRSPPSLAARAASSVARVARPARRLWYRSHRRNVSQRFRSGRLDGRTADFGRIQQRRRRRREEEKLARAEAPGARADLVLVRAARAGRAAHARC